MFFWSKHINKYIWKPLESNATVTQVGKIKSREKKMVVQGPRASYLQSQLQTPTLFNTSFYKHAHPCFAAVQAGVSETGSPVGT